MQLMNTVFLLISTLFNKIYCELKIINSIFNFNIKDNRMILKVQTLNESMIKNNKKKIFSPKNPLDNIKQIENENKSKNNLILKDNSCTNISSLNAENKKSNESQKYTIIKRNKNVVSFENSKNDSIISKKIPNLDNSKGIYSNNQENIFFDVFNQECNNFLDYNERINLNLFNYCCSTKNSKKYKHIELYIKANSFYRKKMDIAHVFSLLSILENFIRK
jgi:hypothetical protein